MSILPRTIATADGLSVDRTGPESLIELLNLYFDELEHVGVPVRNHALPPVPAREIRDRLSGIGLSAPEELVAWYETFNGLSFASGEQPFGFPHFALHSLDEAIRLYRQEADVLGYGNEPWHWNPQWLRVGDPVHSIAVRCDPDDPTTTLVRSVGNGHNTQERRPEYQVVSLCTPVTWWIEGLRAGLYSWNARTLRWAQTDARGFGTEKMRTGLI